MLHIINMDEFVDPTNYVFYLNNIPLAMIKNPSDGLNISEKVVIDEILYIVKDVIHKPEMNVVEYYIEKVQ